MCNMWPPNCVRRWSPDFWMPTDRPYCKAHLQYWRPIRSISARVLGMCLLDMKKSPCPLKFPRTIQSGAGWLPEISCHQLSEKTSWSPGVDCAGDRYWRSCLLKTSSNLGHSLPPMHLPIAICMPKIIKFKESCVEAGICAWYWSCKKSIVSSSMVCANISMVAHDGSWNVCGAINSCQRLQWSSWTPLQPQMHLLLGLAP